MEKPRLSGKKRSLRKVGFQPQIKLLVFSFDESDLQTSWYTQQDYQVFGKDVKATIRTLRKGNEIDICCRGLEKYQSMQYHDEKKRREQTHYRTILLEQERQKQQGHRNPKVLRMLSTVNSQWAIQNALNVAIQDAVEATWIEPNPRHVVVPLSLPLKDTMEISKGFDLPNQLPTPVNDMIRASTTQCLLVQNCNHLETL